MISELIQVRPATMDETGRITQKAVVEIEGKLNTVEAHVVEEKNDSIDLNKLNLNSVNYIIFENRILSKEDLKLGVYSVRKLIR